MQNKRSLLIPLVCILFFWGSFGLTLLFLDHSGYLIPAYANWHKQTITQEMADEIITFSLQNRKLTISNESETLYQTAQGVFISDLILYDTDHDGTDEICVLAWKRGSYGNHLPFWQKEDTKEYSQHIFFYKWDSQRKDRLDPLWMSSDLGRKVTSITLDDHQQLHLVEQNGNESTWVWHQWGLHFVE